MWQNGKYYPINKDETSGNSSNNEDSHKVRRHINFKVRWLF